MATNSHVERSATNNEENETSAACAFIQPVNGDISVANTTESNCPYANQRSNFEQSVASCAKAPDNLSRAGVFPPISSVKLMEAKKTVMSFTLPRVARQSCTLSFLVYAFSFAVVIFIVGIFTTIAADLASDRGLNPSNAVHFLKALSADCV